MIREMLDKELKVEVAIVTAIYEVVRTAHEALCYLAAVDDQEHDKVIEEFFGRISIDYIIVEDSFSEVENKAKKK